MHITIASAVSGAQNYQELCNAAKNEEFYLSELNKWQQCLRNSSFDAATDCQYRGDTVHVKILAGEKLANLVNHELFTNIFIANIHKYTENVLCIWHMY